VINIFQDNQPVGLSRLILARKNDPLNIAATRSGPPPATGSSKEGEGPIPVGVTLDNKYLVRRILGRGSMGIVYLAEDLALEREVAIKVLLPLYAADEKVAKRFRREAVAMASVRHENVVQIFAFGDYSGNPFFVMEYIPGQTVGNLLESANLRNEHLYLDVVIGILNQVCRGLQSVHDRKIVHRDVKPANMLIGPRFTVAITDFGLVENADDSLLQRDLAGTPLYLAPELIRRETIPSDQRHLCDIYALGVSTFEMITGQVPFDGNNVKEILQRHLKDPPPLVSDLRSDVPRAFNEVIGRTLHKDPTARYTSCMDFFEAISEARESESLAPRTGTSRILVVDDDPEIRSIYTTALRVGLSDAIVVAVEDGLAALEMVKGSKPDLILLDLEMPKISGFEVCATLTGDELTASIPLIVLTSHKEDQVRTLLKNMGVRNVLTKPVELTHLVDLARKYLRR
jgi:eukaryotic-like serine/threonine-protein kinase